MFKRRCVILRLSDLCLDLSRRDRLSIVMQLALRAVNRFGLGRVKNINAVLTFSGMRVALQQRPPPVLLEQGAAKDFKILIVGGNWVQEPHAVTIWT